MTKKIISVILALTLIFPCVYSNLFSASTADAASSGLVNNMVYYIKNKRTGKYLTASSSSSGATLSLQNFSKGVLQKFKLKKETINGTTYFLILLHENANLRVTVMNSNDTDGARIGLTTTTTTTSAHRFKFVVDTSCGQNSYRIMPQLSSGRVFSIVNNLGPGVPVSLYGNNSTYYHQDWIMEMITLDYTICPNVKIHMQERRTTCGCACVRNIMSAFDLVYPEDDIYNLAQAIAEDEELDYTYVLVLTETINTLLAANNIDITYSFESLGNVTDENWYAFLIGLEAAKGYPVMFNGNFQNNPYVPYATTGHYVLGTGLKTPYEPTVYTAIISDTYNVDGDIHAGIWEMPIGQLKASNQAHSSRGFCIAAELDDV